MAENSDARPVALVTGGSRGIGRAVVQRLAADGYDIGFCYQSNAAAADEVAEKARALGATVLARRVDVASMDEVAAFVTEVGELGGIRAVVTSAGVVRDKPPALMSGDDWQAVLRINLEGTFNVCRSVVRKLMRQPGASIVTLSSVAGGAGNAGQANYAASKARARQLHHDDGRPARRAVDSQRAVDGADALAEPLRPVPPSCFAPPRPLSATMSRSLSTPYRSARLPR